MKRTILLVLSCVSIALYSCSDKKTTETQSDITPAQEIVSDGTVPAPAAPAPDPASGTTQITAEPVTMTPANVQAVPVTGTTAQPSASAEGLNPAHGQPGHRCDIAVGAPLSSPPGAGTPAVTSTPVTTTPSGNTKMPTAESKTVNEKVVFQSDPSAGSPSSLSGSPVTASPGTASPGTAAPATKSSVVTAPGMNPPHGEPGHDCASSSRSTIA